MHLAGAVTEVKNQVNKVPYPTLPYPTIPSPTLPYPQLANGVVLVRVVILLFYCVDSKKQDQYSPLLSDRRSTAAHAGHSAPLGRLRELSRLEAIP